MALIPLKEKPTLSGYKKGDHLVLFGELFQRGYANGLVEEAERQGLQVIRSTVGRRDKDGHLRPLNAEELATHSAPFINIPLEAGFDFYPDGQGLSPIERLKEAKLSDWKDLRFDFAKIEESRQAAERDFCQRVRLYFSELKKLIQPGKNVLLAHLMAGGVPRAKIIMPLMNRTFKGRGERYLPSEEFWQSDIGRLCEINFYEVTAETFRHMVELSEDLRKHVEKNGGQVSYVAYGYHGTEVLLGGDYQWTTYTPYLQGWAKLRLENHSQKFHQQGLQTCVYNCPEILTNSSSIFQGVEVFLYTLLESLKKEAHHNPRTQQITQQCQSLLKDEVKLSDLSRDLWAYFQDPVIKAKSLFEAWPQHSSQAQLERMLTESEKVMSWHKDEKNLMSAVLSEVIFEGCGYAMFHDCWRPQEPVRWLGHNLVSRCLQNP